MRANGRQYQDAKALLGQGRYAEALAVADAAIGRLLHDGLSVEEFVRFALRGAAPESLLRVERRAVLRFRHLHEPLALRWEVLRRWGRTEEAKQMRRLCTRHFPERASVWATAGNHALDEERYEEAQAYFARCLRCDPRWTAGLAGMAIVCEAHKDWPRALAYRKRVVEHECALDKYDPPSLQRVLRYAAALARVGRWPAAEGLLRRCVERGAYRQLPAERAMLLRVFSGQLYAPAVVAGFAIPRAGATAEVQLALREAKLLACAAQSVMDDPTLDATARLKHMGICKWLAGDEALAYALFDEAEVEAPDDLMVQCMLAWTAATTDAEGRQHVERFALERSMRCVAAANSHGASAIDLACAAITLARAGHNEQALAPLRSHKAATQPWLRLSAQALSAELPDAGSVLAVGADQNRYASLQQVLVYRAALRVVGRSGYEAARASAAALRFAIGAG